MSRASHTALGPGGEFDLVRRLVARWGDRAAGIGDDAAVLDVPLGAQLVASVDTSVESVHFRREWLTPREIGYRATAAALSDLAAMAALPLGVLLSLTLPPELAAWVDELGDGVGDAAGDAQCPIVGGDVTAGERLSLSLTVLGHAVAPVRRRGATAGDRVYVTGRLGAPGAALSALRNGERPAPAIRERFAHPQPRLREARWLAEHGAHAMIDISDGLAPEARHLASASGVSLALVLDALPCATDVAPLDAVVSGEEYELLLTAPGPIDIDAFALAFGIPLTPIGEVNEAGATDVSFTLHGMRVDPGTGYDHFSR